VSDDTEFDGARGFSLRGDLARRLKMSPCMKSTITMATLAMSAVLASTAVAAPRTTELTLDRYDRPVIVERERDDLKKAAVFSADPQAIDENAIVLIEIHSISATPRSSASAASRRPTWPSAWASAFRSRTARPMRGSCSR